MKLDGEKLLVHHRFAGYGPLLKRLAAVMLSILHVRQFSDSRMLGGRRPTQTLMGGWSFGLDSLVSYVRAQPNTSEYYIHGYDRLSHPIRLPRDSITLLYVEIGF